MKRPAPARLRELRLGSPTASEQPKSIFSRVPLLQSSSDVQDWAAGDHIPGLLIPIGMDPPIVARSRLFRLC
jgi:hypothetical protein